jgi:hypothetical protein
MSCVDSEPVISADPRPESPVSPNDPCPFLRALVAGGHISGHVEQLSIIADAVITAAGSGPTLPPLLSVLQSGHSRQLSWAYQRVDSTAAFSSSPF